MSNDKYGFSTHPIYPKIGTISTSVRERMLASILEVNIPNTNRSIDKKAQWTRYVPASQPLVDLASDVFFSLYKAVPELAKEPPIPRYLNHALIRLLQSAQGYDTLRVNTVGSIVTSLHTASKVVGALITDQAIRDAMRLQEDLEKLRQRLQELGSQLDGGGDGQSSDQQGEGDDEQSTGQQRPQPQPGSQPQLPTPEEQEQEKQRQQQEKHKKEQKIIRDKMEKTEQDIKKLERIIQKQVDGIVGNTLSKGMANMAIKNGADGANQLQAMMTSWGVEEGEMSYLDANMLCRVAAEKQNSLGLVAELSGRVAEVSAETLQAVRDSYVGTPSEPTYTRNLLRIFPTERAYMSGHAPPYLRATKVTEWAQRGLLGLRPKSEGKKRGALVVAVDGSTSMDYGACSIVDKDGEKINLTRSELAKVVAIGVARAMRDDRFERRRYTIFTFANDVWMNSIVTSASDWQDTMRWVSEDPNGGTEFQNAFDFALDELERFEQDGTLGADFLLISDGESGMSEKVEKRFLEYKDRTGARVFYIQIGKPDSYRVKSSANVYAGIYDMTRLADAHVSITDEKSIDDLPSHLAQQVSAVFAQVG